MVGRSRNRDEEIKIGVVTDDEADYFTYTMEEEKPNEKMKRTSPEVGVIRASVAGRRETNTRYSAIEDEDGGSGASRSGTFAEDLVELECDLPELLNQYKYHPLNYMFPQEIANIGKTDDYSMYSFYSQEFE